MKQKWTEKTWNEVIEIRSGRNQKEVEDPNGEFPIIGSAGKVMGYANDYICEGGTTIVGRKGTINNPMLIEEKFWNVDTAFGLHAKDGLNNRFLHYFCLGFDFTEMDKGSGRPSLVKSDLLKIKMLVPPLPEQQRIVSILDEAFASIARAKVNAEQNLKNAAALFESYLQGVFEKKGDEWDENRLGDLCSIGDGNYSSKYPKASEFVSEGIPFLTATNLKNGTVITDGIRFISREQHATLTKGHIIKGDLVIVVRGSSTGNNSIVPGEYAGSNLNSQLAFLRVNDNKLSSEYLFAVFNSPPVMKTVKAAITGAAQPQLPNNKLLDIKISYPNLKEQQTIVRQLDALRAETQKLEAVYQKKMDDLEELKKSILQKAFAGELKTGKAVVL